jgi:shikimate dehydrogenase
MAISGRTEFFGLLAHPVDHVRAPGFYNQMFAERGRDACMIPLHVLPEDIPDVLPRLGKLRNFKGISLTIPHKETCAALCDELGPEAALCGSANALRFDPDGRLRGEMFDGPGFMKGCAANGIGLDGKRVLMVGTGGAGRAVAFALARAGVAGLTLANRTAERAERLAADIAAKLPDTPVAAGPTDPSGHDVIVNCTSLGLHEGDPLPLDASRLSAEMTIVDIIAAREETELMAAGRALGCKTLNGQPMAVHQIADIVAFFDARPAA